MEPDDPLWRRAAELNDQVTKLSVAQAKMESNMLAMSESLRNGFESVNHAMAAYAADMARISEKQNKPVNMLGIGGMILSLFVAFLSFMALVTAPLTEKTNSNAAAISEITRQALKDAYADGRNDERTRNNQELGMRNEADIDELLRERDP